MVLRMRLYQALAAQTILEGSVHCWILVFFMGFVDNQRIFISTYLSKRELLEFTTIDDHEKIE